MTLTFGSH
uniref:Uncharacterized protein n=1 Tax=Arundo donax TaxID=35708 RepID=A0A0A9AN91_ARUDO